MCLGKRPVCLHRNAPNRTRGPSYELHGGDRCACWLNMRLPASTSINRYLGLLPCPALPRASCQSAQAAACKQLHLTAGVACSATGMYAPGCDMSPVAQQLRPKPIAFSLTCLDYTSAHQQHGTTTARLRDTKPRGVLRQALAQTALLAVGHSARGQIYASGKACGTVILKSCPEQLALPRPPCIYADA